MNKLIIAILFVTNINCFGSEWWNPKQCEFDGLNERNHRMVYDFTCANESAYSFYVDTETLEIKLLSMSIYDNKKKVYTDIDIKMSDCIAIQYNTDEYNVIVYKRIYKYKNEEAAYNDIIRVWNKLKYLIVKDF